MKIDIRKTPFSRFGSYFVLSLLEQDGEEQLCIRDIRGGDNDPGLIFRMKVLDTNGAAIPYQIDADETELRISAGSRMARICLPDYETLRIHSRGLIYKLELALKKYDHINPLGSKIWELHSYSQRVKMLLELRQGQCRPHLSWYEIGNSKAELEIGDSEADLLIQSYIRVPEKTGRDGSYEEGLAAVQNEYKTYLGLMPRAMDQQDEESRELASYITWSSVVKPSGILQRFSMYMSNNWMTNLWSWDNCFNAIGLSRNLPELAYDQYIVFHDFQDESGVLPDYINDDHTSFACCKPPVHGWAYSILMKRNSFFRRRDVINQSYSMLTGMERYWRVHRTRDSFPLPYYNHGNDSGWDNATVFAEGCPVTSPDLPAYLVLLYEALEEMAKLTDRDSEARQWRNRGDAMVTRLIDALWDGRAFRSYNHVENRFVNQGDSFINLMPIVIGHRLPAALRNALVQRLLSSDFRTEFGLATESLSSPYYRSDGYWRGPIWAPITLLLIDGLMRAGVPKASRELGASFRHAVRVGGMAENFDAETGEGLVDPALTWTASVFLTLLDEEGMR